MLQRLCCFLCLGCFAHSSLGQNLQTRWAAGVTPENAHREYPRPQMVRPGWVNLNGLWDLTIAHADGTSSKHSILVPFPVESQLSRVHVVPAPSDKLIYRRTFTRPRPTGRVLLHFEAVDWATTVRINGTTVGSHRGGYGPFSFDITAALRPSGTQRLEVEVRDPSDTGPQPRGKQVMKPGGIFYTSTSGIWQTVWLESVPIRSIESISVTATNNGLVQLQAGISEPPGLYAQFDFGGGKRGVRRKSDYFVRTEVLASGKAIARGQGDVLDMVSDGVDEKGRWTSATNVQANINLQVKKPNLWSPEHPFIYNLRFSLIRRGKVVDQVKSYFAFRDISLVRDKTGQQRIALNGKPYFMVGPLDQGFWPDGIYTAPSEAAMKYDLDVTKRLGFNMIRKHVKVEPDRWYYLCDKMGILVMQDMPSGDRGIGPNDPDIVRSPESAQIFRDELKAMIDARRNHPCIVSWVLYNEGWGQWDTARMTQWLKKYDPSRLVDATTGWADRGVGDMNDVHVYPGPGAPPRDLKRALMLGEFGGLGLPVPGHMWRATGWGYQSFKTKQELTDAFVRLLSDLRFLIAKPGLSGAVYTQTTDVETELNGLMTYDRALIKMDEARMRQAVRELFLPPPTFTEIVPTSESTPQTWEYQLAPGPWLHGPGGFGTPETPGSVVRTRWDTEDIWLRRKFVLPKNYLAGDLWLRLSYDDDVEVRIDDKIVYTAPGWTTSYKLLPLQVGLAKGEHTLSIHCHQNEGGQYVDAGLVVVKQ